MSDAKPNAQENLPAESDYQNGPPPTTIVEYADPIYTLQPTDQVLNVILPTFIQAERIHSFGYNNPTPRQLSLEQQQLPAPLPLRSQSSPVKDYRQSDRRFSQDSGMFRDTSPYVSRC